MTTILLGVAASTAMAQLDGREENLKCRSGAIISEDARCKPLLNSGGPAVAGSHSGPHKTHLINLAAQQGHAQPEPPKPSAQKIESYEIGLRKAEKTGAILGGGVGLGLSFAIAAGNAHNAALAVMGISLFGGLIGLALGLVAAAFIYSAINGDRPSAANKRWIAEPDVQEFN